MVKCAPLRQLALWIHFVNKLAESRLRCQLLLEALTKVRTWLAATTLVRIQTANVLGLVIGTESTMHISLKLLLARVAMGLLSLIVLLLGLRHGLVIVCCGPGSLVVGFLTSCTIASGIESIQHDPVEVIAKHWWALVLLTWVIQLGDLRANLLTPGCLLLSKGSTLELI